MVVRLIPAPATIIAYREAIGGRRFIMCNITGAACFVLLWFGKLDSASFTTIILGTIAVYIAGRTTEAKWKSRSPDDVPDDTQ